jgi:hypothetical protein
MMALKFKMAEFAHFILATTFRRQRKLFHPMVGFCDLNVSRMKNNSEEIVVYLCGFVVIAFVVIIIHVHYDCKFQLHHQVDGKV